MTCNAHAHPQRSCLQGRQPCPTPWSCQLRTNCGGESVNTEIPSEDIPEKTPLPLLFWIALILSAAVSLAWLVAAYPPKF